MKIHYVSIKKIKKICFSAFLKQKSIFLMKFSTILRFVYIVVASS